jgi:hypothetical protein
MVNPVELGSLGQLPFPRDWELHSHGGSRQQPQLVEAATCGSFISHLRVGHSNLIPLFFIDHPTVFLKDNPSVFGVVEHFHVDVHRSSSRKPIQVDDGPVLQKAGIEQCTDFETARPMSP